MDRQTKQQSPLIKNSLLPTYLPLTTTLKKIKYIPSTQVVFFWITVVLKMSSQSRITAFVLFIFELKSNYNVVWYFTFCRVSKNPFVLAIEIFNYYSLQILLF